MPNATLLQPVVYIGTKGHKKAALVIGTPESIDEGTQVPVPSEGYLHLLVFSPTGNAYPKFNVPSEEVAKTIPDYHADDNGNLREVWREQ